MRRWRCCKEEPCRSPSALALEPKGDKSRNQRARDNIAVSAAMDRECGNTENQIDEEQHRINGAVPF